MDFGDILKNWENDKHKISKHKKDIKQADKKENQTDMEELLKAYAPDSDVLETKVEEKPYIQKVSREKMRRKKADLVLDLHGMTSEEAEIELNNFIRRVIKTERGKF